MPGVPCARHPNVETYVRCQRCETPICPQCMVSTPVGMKCRDCASNAAAPYLRSSGGEAVLSALGGMGTALALGWMLAMCWFGCLPYGIVVGEVVLRAGKRKRGRTARIIAVTSVLVGVAAYLAVTPTWHRLQVFAGGVVAAFLAYSRVRDC